MRSIDIDLCIYIQGSIEQPGKIKLVEIIKDRWVKFWLLKKNQKKWTQNEKYFKDVTTGGVAMPPFPIIFLYERGPHGDFEMQR